MFFRDKDGDQGRGQEGYQDQEKGAAQNSHHPETGSFIPGVGQSLPHGLNVLLGGQARISHTAHPSSLFVQFDLYPS